MNQLKKCKKHDRLPYLKEIIPDGLSNTYNYFGKQFKYVCSACELEEEENRQRPLIDEWNKKQGE